VDFGLFGEGGTYLQDGGHPAYLACGQLGEALGCVWGGRWKMMDAGHLEWHAGTTIDALKAAGGLKA
jgi:hypothetical protein